MEPIPSPIRRAIFLHQAKWPLIFLVSALICLGFQLSQKDWYAYFYLDENSPVTTGQIVDKWVEVYSEAEYEDEDDYYLYGYAYSFYSPAGELIYRTAYGTDFKLLKGDSIRIQYHADEPRINKALGMQAAASSGIWFMLFILLMFAFIIAVFVCKPIRALFIVKQPALARGRVWIVDKKETLLTERHRQFWVKFTTENGTSISTQVNPFNYWRITDDSRELLVYQKNKPKRLFFIDKMPRKVRDYFHSTYPEKAGTAKLRQLKKLEKLRAKRSAFQNWLISFLGLDNF